MNLQNLENKLLNYLGDVEGWYIHKNSTERDVTAFYGIYRAEHPKFAGWWWLDDLAKQHKLKQYRTKKKQRNKLNWIIKTDPILREIYDDIAKFWHMINASKMGLDHFPDAKTALTYFSLYTNSQQGAGLSLQRAINEMSDTYLRVDGVAGKHTLAALSTIKDAAKLNELILMNMQDYYNALIRARPAKYKRYANGWTNRLKGLA